LVHCHRPLSRLTRVSVTVLCGPSAIDETRAQKKHQQTTRKDERSEDTQPKRSRQQEYHIRKDGIREHIAQLDRSSLRLRNALDALVRKQERRDGHVSCNKPEPDEYERVAPFRPLGSITERGKEAHDEKPGIAVVEDQVEDVDLGNVIFERFGENDERDVAVVLIRVRYCDT